MENIELLNKIIRAKKRLIKMMEDFEKQSDVEFGYLDKLPEIYVHRGIGEVSRILDQFMVAEKSEIPENPLVFRVEHDGIKLLSMGGGEDGEM